MFWIRSTSSAHHTPAAMPRRWAPNRRGANAQAKAPSAPSPTGTPHSATHCTTKFSACVKTRLPGVVRYSGKTLSKAPRPTPKKA